MSKPILTRLQESVTKYESLHHRSQVMLRLLTSYFKAAPEGQATYSLRTTPATVTFHDLEPRFMLSLLAHYPEVRPGRAHIRLAEPDAYEIIWLTQASPSFEFEIRVRRPMALRSVESVEDMQGRWAVRPDRLFTCHIAILYPTPESSHPGVPEMYLRNPGKRLIEPGPGTPGKITVARHGIRAPETYFALRDRGTGLKAYRQWPAAKATLPITTPQLLDWLMQQENEPVEAPAVEAPAVEAPAVQPSSLSNQISDSSENDRKPLEVDLPSSDEVEATPPSPSPPAATSSDEAEDPIKTLESYLET